MTLFTEITHLTPHIRFYKDHLTPVDSLFDFNMSLDSYDEVSHVVSLLIQPR